MESNWRSAALWHRESPSVQCGATAATASAPENDPPSQATCFCAFSVFTSTSDRCCAFSTWAMPSSELWGTAVPASSVPRRFGTLCRCWARLQQKQVLFYSCGRVKIFLTLVQSAGRRHWLRAGPAKPHRAARSRAAADLSAGYTIYQGRGRNSCGRGVQGAAGSLVNYGSQS